MRQLWHRASENTGLSGVEKELLAEFIAGKQYLKDGNFTVPSSKRSSSR